MANVDAKTRLNLKIGAAKHSLPLYDDYSDFYNGKYVRIKTFNKDLYAPLTTTRSDMSVNAGVIVDDTRYYFLTSAFEQGEGFASTGYYHHISRNGVHYGPEKALTATVNVPEDGLYTVDIKAYLALGYNAHHNYRANSNYRLMSKIGDIVLTDTGMHNGMSSIFYPYTVGEYISDGRGRKWFTMGSNVEVELKAGANRFDLWVEMYDTGNKHAEVYVDPFQVEISYSGYKKYIKITENQEWTCPANVKTVNYSLYGAGGGAGGTARADYDDQDDVYHGVGYGGDGGTGELVSGTVSVKAGQKYSLVVGKGGTNGSDATREGETSVSAGDGTAGGNTTAFGATARGGGAGSGGYVSRENDDGWTWVEGHDGANGKSYAGGASPGQDGWIILRYND